MQELFENVVHDVGACNILESLVCGKGFPKMARQRIRKPVKNRTAAPATSQPVAIDVKTIVKKTVESCRETRRRLEKNKKPPTDDETLSALTRFTDTAALEPFEKFLYYVPRLVNVVTLAEAVPVPGSGLTLPLDLHLIATRCTGAYFAPKRFSVRCRIQNWRGSSLTHASCVQRLCNSPTLTLVLASSSSVRFHLAVPIDWLAFDTAHPV